MYPVYFGLLLGSVFALLLLIRGDSAKWVSVVFGIILFPIIGGVVGLVATMPIELLAPKEWYKSGEIKLIALKNGFGVHGTFFLGSGTIEGGSVYRYYTQTSDGGIVQSQVNASNTTIYEEKRKDGVLEMWDRRVTGKWKNYVISGNCSCSERIKILVPKGTVVRNYVAD